MALTRTPMSPEEATVLAAQIDQSHMPYSVKRVVQDGPNATLEIRDDTTGYLLFIHNAEHWRTFIAHSGNAGAIDMFCEASVNILAYITEQINAAKEERDRYFALAEQADGKATALQTQYDSIEQAMAAVNNLPNIKSAPKQDPPKLKQAAPRSNIQRTKRPEGAPLQGKWIVDKLKQYGRIKVGELADEMVKVYPLTRERAMANISGELSRAMQMNRRIVRAEMGVYEYNTAEESN
jgi:hypothetical protein